MLYLLNDVNPVVIAGSPLPAHQCMIQSAGWPHHSREKWVVSGKAPDGENLEIVCVIDVDEIGRVVVFITVYWNER